MQACLCHSIIRSGDFHLPLCWDGRTGYREVGSCQKQVAKSNLVTLSHLASPRKPWEFVVVIPDIHLRIGCFQSREVDWSELNNAGIGACWTSSFRVSPLGLIQLD